MSEHTKGPWTLKHEAYCISVENSNGIVSEQYLPDSDGRDDAYDQEEQAKALADAQLIAKAPGMHAALTRIAFRCQSFLADERIMQLESIEAILNICDSALD